ncbi:MAG TPA: ABC transporter permease [Candidatus Acidoferrum sp.]
MSLRNVGIVYRKELTEALRDSRTLISSILIPLFLFPVLTVGIGYAFVEVADQASHEASRIMVLGGADSPDVVQKLKDAKNLRIVKPRADYVDLISNKKIRAAVDLPPGFQSDVEHGAHPDVKIYIFSGDLKSMLSATRIKEQLTEYRDSMVRDRLAAQHLPDSLMKPFGVEQQNVVSEDRVAGESYGGLITYLVILMCMTGAMYPAMDLTAGEKERGTMETILSSPIERTHLVLGKFLVVLTASLATATLSVLSMAGSFAVLAHYGKGQGIGDDFPILTMHAKTAFAIFIMALPVAVLFSAVLMTISLFAKTFKEAQSYLTPMTFLVIVPAIAAVIPGIELTAKLALVPILNVGLLCKELVTGTYHWEYIALIFGCTCVYAGIALFLAVKMFQRESVLFSS